MRYARWLVSNVVSVACDLCFCSFCHSQRQLPYLANSTVDRKYSPGKRNVRMSPLNRGPLLGHRAPPAGVRPLPPPRFGGRLVPPGMPMAPPMINPVFGISMRQRLPLPLRLTGVSRPNGLLPLFPGPRARGMALAIMPPMRPRGSGVLRGPVMARRIPPLQMMPPQMPLIPPMTRPMRPRFATGNGNAKGKTINTTKKVTKLEVRIRSRACDCNDRVV